MEKFFRLIQRSRASIHFAVVLVFGSANLALAQQKADITPGIIHIKVTEALAAQLEQAPLARRAGDAALVTGVARLDRVHQQFRVHGMKRVFRSAGKFESKHRKYGLHRWYEVALDSTVSVSAVLSAYRGMVEVERSEPVYKKHNGDGVNKATEATLEKTAVPAGTLPRTTNDPLVNLQWHYNNTGRGTLYPPNFDIRLFRAWEIETGKSNVIVAVVDGAVHAGHEDLAANMWVNVGEIPGNMVDDDANGYIDDVNGYGFVYDRGTVAPDDHGTHVGGTVAATTNNGIGMAGVAGGSGTGDGARLMSCAVFSNSGASSGIAESYIYSADHGAVISQNSWGYYEPGVYEQVVIEAIDYFIAEAGRDENGHQTGPMNGGIVIFAAGNANADAAWYPGYYEPTLSVAATNRRDQKAYYSNFGSWVDIAAPGGEYYDNATPIYSTLPYNTYGTMQGTSMACPHVSGVAALIVSKFGGPGFTPATLRSKILQTTDNIDGINPAFAGKLGTGRLNAYAALQINDQLPPERITDLSVADVKEGEVTVRWTAPADAGSASASAYEIRYALFPITEANFGTASRISTVVVPRPYGQEETLTFRGLQPATTYYFAIQSKDFFGTASAISNVVQQATLPAASILLLPTTVSVNLKTARTAVRTLRVVNRGLATLTFSLEKLDDNAFATLSQTEGTVEPTDTLAIAVSFDSHDRPAGVHTQRYRVISNSYPANAVFLNLHMGVIANGAPIATLPNDTIDFGIGFPGVPLHRTVSVHNDGSDTLRIASVTSEHPVFTTSFAGPMVIPPFQDGSFVATFTGVTVRSHSARINLQTNDPNRANLRVRLLAKCALPPDIVTSPPSLHALLNSGKTTSHYVTVQNTGESDLLFSTRFSNPHAPETVHAIIVSSDFDPSPQAELLSAIPNLVVDVYPLDLLPTISLEDLLPYDVVLVTNWSMWEEEANVNPPSIIGDVLADYVDTGGKVLMSLFSFASAYDYAVEGRLIDDGYAPLIPSDILDTSQKSLGTVLLPGHPIMTGVDTIDYPGWSVDAPLAPGAVEIARWNNGHTLVAARQSVVCINYALPFAIPGETGDLLTLYGNTIQWLVNTSFVSVSPTSGSVAKGASQQLEVTFDARQLLQKETLEASLIIDHNVPGKGPALTPLSLTVLGPEFVFVPDSVYHEVEQGSVSTHTLVLHNQGFETRAFTAAIDSSAYVTITPVAGSVAAGDSVAFTLRFDSKDLPFSNHLNKVTVSIAGTDLDVPVAWSVVGDPDIAIQPNVIQAVANFKEDTVQHFQITNRGGKPLHYTLEIAGADVDAAGMQAMIDQAVPTKKISRKASSIPTKTDKASAGRLQAMHGELLLEEDFEHASFPPPGWTVIDNEGYNAVWSFASAHGEGNYCSEGEAAMASSHYEPNEVEIDTELRSPVIHVRGYENVVLQFIGNHQGAYLDIDIRVEGSAEWQRVEQWWYMHGYEFSKPGEFVSLELDPFLNGAASFQLRWRHYVPSNGYDWDYYSQVDDIVVLGDATAWLTVGPAEGVVPIGGTIDITARFHADDLDTRLYVAGILVHSNDVDDPLEGVVASLQVLEPATINVAPDSLTQTLAKGTTATQTLTLTNSGASLLRFSIGTDPETQPLAAQQTKRIPGVKRTQANTRSVAAAESIPHAAVATRTARAVPAAGAPLYSTTFEDFYLGEIDGQNGWWSDPGMWSIEDSHPFGGQKYFQGTSDGLGVAVAGTPNVGLGTADIMSTTVYINLDSAEGASWQVVPQAPIIGWVVTRFVVNADGTMKVLVRDSLDYYNYYYVDLQVPRPKGYFQVRIDVEQSTQTFTLYFDNKKIFTGLAFASFIEEVAFVSNMEVAGPTFYADNVAIFAGLPPLAWARPVPSSGTVASGASLPVNILFDATDMGPGTYRQVMMIGNNDPANPVVGLPVTLHVTEQPNQPPVVQPADTAVAQTDTRDVMFTATDPDGTVTSVDLVNPPAFMHKVSTTGTRTYYRIHPSLTDAAGLYEITIQATDNKGATGTGVFMLTVLPYGVVDFSVIDTRTGAARYNFSDSVTLDAGLADFRYLNIRANTSRDRVGSVLFRMDGAKKNISNTPPYLFHSTALGSLPAGYHALVAETYTRGSATGTLHHSKGAVVSIVNTAAVAGVDVVDDDGNVVQVLHEGDVFNTLDGGFDDLHLRANLSQGSAAASVKFWLNDDFSRSDNTVPYTLASSWWDSPGTYALSAAPYSKPYGAGVPGVPLVVSFSVVEGSMNARSGASGTAAAAADEKSDVKIFPMPVRHELNVHVAEGVLPPSESVQLSIRNVHGQTLYTSTVSTEALRAYVLMLDEAALSSGVYFLQLSTTRTSKSLKFVKE